MASEFAEELEMMAIMCPAEMTVCRGADVDAESKKLGEKEGIEINATVSFDVHPVVPHGHDEFVSCRIRLALDERHYPAVRGIVAIAASEGLDDSGEDMLRRALTECSIDHAESSMASLFAIYQKCEDFLSERNDPQGDCAVCLCPLLDDTDPEPCLKLRCSHCLHRTCLLRWLHDVQVRNTDPATRPKDGILPPSCPICRREVGERLLEKLGGELSDMMGEHETRAAACAEQEEEERREREREEAAKREEVRQMERKLKEESFVAQPVMIIRGLSKRKTNIKTLSHIVAKWNPVLTRLVTRDKVFAGFAVVSFGTMEAAQKAVSALHGTMYNGKEMSCSIATFNDLASIPGWVI